MEVGTDSVIASAVDWCTDNGVDIISLSLGGQQGINLIFLSTDELEDAVNRAINQGIYVVAAAGNDGGDNDDGDVSSPGSVEDVICVGAIDTDGSMWRNSSVGDNNWQVWPLKQRVVTLTRNRNWLHLASVSRCSTPKSVIPTRCMLGAQAPVEQPFWSTKP